MQRLLSLQAKRTHVPHAHIHTRAYCALLLRRTRGRTPPPRIPPLPSFPDRALTCDQLVVSHRMRSPEVRGGLEQRTVLAQLGLEQEGNNLGVRAVVSAGVLLLLSMKHERFYCGEAPVDMRVSLRPVAPKPTAPALTLSLPAATSSLSEKPVMRLSEGERE